MGQEVFEAVDGIRFWWAGDLLTFRAGVYANGRGAILLEEESGEPFGKLTVNLDDVLLSSDNGFFVKWAASDGALRGSPLHRGVESLGLFKDTGRRVDAGMVEHYAAEWTFALCENAEHVQRGAPRVRCEGCRVSLEEAYQRGAETRRARDAASRLRGLGRELGGRL